MPDTQSMIGKLLPADAARDAIHVAVAPVEAGEPLSPGQHVTLNDLLLAFGVGGGGKGFGVVDPFLTGRVFPGERFFVFLYPNTITGLRHEWTHPAFIPKPIVPVVMPDEANDEPYRCSDCPDQDD